MDVTIRQLTERAERAEWVLRRIRPLLVQLAGSKGGPGEEWVTQMLIATPANNALMELDATLAKVPEKGQG